jgi:anti-anti-sigma regulatory factor
MATNKESDLIGYDPLAWLGLEPEDGEQLLNLESTAPADLNVEPQLECEDDFDQVVENMTEIEQLIEDGDACAENDSKDVDAELKAADDFIAGETLIEADEFLNEMDSIDAITVDVDEENNELVETMAEQEISPMVDLDATLTIQHVGALHEKLKLCLAMHDEIEINASDVSAIDTANLQLLVALKKDAANLEKQVSIIYPSPRFIESAQLLGLLAILDVTA